MNTKTILAIEDQETDQRLLRDTLEAEGYLVHIASAGEEGLRLLEQLRPDLVILDLVMPGMDGLACCRQIRARSQVPVMMVTGKREEVDTVIGLELGADDYLGKPFGVRELVARVRALLRRMEVLEERRVLRQHIALPQLEIDYPAREVEVSGRPVRLTPKEFELLFALASGVGRVYSREELMEKVWGRSGAGEDMRTVDTHIKRLRRKLEERFDVPWSIITVWGVGYKLELDD